LRKFEGANIWSSKSDESYPAVGRSKIKFLGLAPGIFFGYEERFSMSVFV
jgi:hypothetical protein